MTYMLRSRLLEQDGDSSFNWLDLTLAPELSRGRRADAGEGFYAWCAAVLRQHSLNLSSRQRSPSRAKIFRSLVAGRHWEQRSAVSHKYNMAAALGFGRGAGVDPSFEAGHQSVPDRGCLLRSLSARRSASSTPTFELQQSNHWYVEVGQRYSREGNRVRRGDIWNPISFNEVYAPTEEIQFCDGGRCFSHTVGMDRRGEGLL